jgi:hypothetical protein
MSKNLAIQWLEKDSFDFSACRLLEEQEDGDATLADEATRRRTSPELA